MVVASSLACAASGPSDPRSAAQSYARAVEADDADALYGMLSDEDRRAVSRDEVRALLTRDRDELREQARAVSANGAHVDALAKIRFKDGEEAALLFEGGRFQVSSAGTIPGGARSPEEALDQLRRALSRRSYPGLLRALSPATRAAIERDLRDLVLALERAGSLPIQNSGEAATVLAPGGHRVKLRREGTVWFVEDFD